MHRAISQGNDDEMRVVRDKHASIDCPALTVS
jgi:hypothetical protein